MMFCHEAVFVGFTPLAGDAILDIGTHRNLYVLS